MNKLNRNIIVLLVFGLILSVNYGAYADSVLDDQESVPEEETKEIINLDDTVEDSTHEDDSSSLETKKTQDRLETENQEGKTEDNKDTEEEIQEDTDLKEEESDKADIQEVSNEQTVSNWQEFSEAFNNESVKKIILANDLTGSSDLKQFKPRYTSLEIDGKSQMIDTMSFSSFGDNLFELKKQTEKQNFSLKNMTIKHSGKNVIKSSTDGIEIWDINLDNIDLATESKQEYLIDGNNIENINLKHVMDSEKGTGILSERSNVNIIDTESNFNAGIAARNIYIIGSDFNISTTDSTNLALYAANRIKISKNSNVKIQSLGCGINVTSGTSEGLVIDDDSNVVMETGDTAIEVLDFRVQASRLDIKTDGIAVNVARNIDIDQAEININSLKKSIVSQEITVNETMFNLKSSDSGVEANSIKFEQVKIDTHTNGDTMISPNIELKKTSGKMVSKGRILNAKNEDERTLIYIRDGSHIDMKGEGNGIEPLVEIGGVNNGTRVRFIVSEESQVKMESIEKPKEYASVVMTTGIKVDSQTSSYGVFVDSKSSLEISTKGNTALILSTAGDGTIALQEHSTFRINQTEGNSVNCSPVKIKSRVSRRGESVGFSLSDNSAIDFNSTQIKTPLILLDSIELFTVVASDSSVAITNSSQIENKNLQKSEGNGLIKNINSVNMTNNDILILINNSGNQKNLNHVNLLSKQGPIIDDIDKLQIIMNQNSRLNIEGKSKSENQAIINAKKVIINNLSADYLNITNNRKGGGKIFSSLSKDSTFSQLPIDAKSQSSPFAVWEHGKDVNGEPSKFWSKLNFELEGENLGYKSSSHEKEFNASEESFGPNGLTPYSRISANNAKPIIDFAPDSYDTDKMIYGHVTVPEGLNGSRNAWEGEVQLEIERTQAGESKTVYDDISTHKSKEEAWGYEDYMIPKERWGGYFKLDLDDFAVAGDRYEIISAYRGQKDQEEERLIHSDLTESEVTEKTVIDGTPPEIATIESPVFEDQATMTGNTLEKGITAKLYDKGTHEIKDKDGKPLEVSDVEGKWEFDISNTKLKKGDKVYVVLKDKIGNVNPFEKFTYHDATFEAAASIIISGPRFEISADDLFTNQKGIIKIENKDNLKVEMNAKGKDNLNDKEIEVEITDLGGLEFEQSETINEVKSHKITFKLKGQDATVIKSVHILPHDNIEQNDKYVIGASDFYTDKKDIDAKEDRIKELANAKAYKKEDMSEQDVRLKDFEKLQFDLPNKLEFVVEADEEVAITVIGRVLNYDHVNNSDKYVVAANDFSIMDYLAVDIKYQTILDRSKAAGWIIEGWQEKDVKVVKHNVEGTVGQYKATIDIVK